MKQQLGIVSKAGQGERISSAEALSLAEFSDLELIIETAGSIRDQSYPDLVTYSPKVFIPLTQLCRDVCHYCTFAQAPKPGEKAYLSADQILKIARAGKEAGCHEALFTLGDKPELRYKIAREELKALGHKTTLSYLKEMAQLVLNETGLLPHLNPGVLEHNELNDLRKVSVSQGMMLESAAKRLCNRGGPHFGSPDKQPGVRLGSIAAAGSTRVPFTSGILIGIGENRRERIESLLALRELNDVDGHIQEIIIQNFRRKPDTKMHDAEEPSLADHLWTIAVARIIFGSSMHIQAPPNLMPDAMPQLVQVGIDDWGGVSPVTVDHVNPEAAWPSLEKLTEATEISGKQLAARLPIYPNYLQSMDKWMDASLHTPVLRCIDSEGYARTDNWTPGAGLPIPTIRTPKISINIKNAISNLIDKAGSGARLNETEVSRLFSARGGRFKDVCKAADAMRVDVNGDVVSYVSNRNINYTNICYFGCGFCAFSKGRVAENLRERGYNISLKEIQERTQEAWQRGATEVCLQGGIHPDYTGETYLSIAKAIKEVQPDIHIHAFSPLEITHGAETLGLSLVDYLRDLKKAGLSTLPGTAAEILDDEIRQIICADKINTQQWLDVMRAAHSVGIRSTSTIMFGHVESPVNWARHLLRLRDLQEETGGFTEFVPLPFVHMEAPLYRKGRTRIGPTYRETLLMHAVSRLVLYPYINNIQASWVKMGKDGVKAALQAGANDMGGNLMNESISKAAGASHGQEFESGDMETLIRSIGRCPEQRTTLYGRPASGAVFLHDAILCNA
ncbi:MAG: 5-amino-6-(D-ribitylamino)uracil--L-tyrosine 4-hydroxyphenyl transferase CofH [Gammaproteobacteria bacterium]|jgi:FO synthase|nr:5-amino-6-(D-ribitylamino)uracil--L-tyrosine 4-hydroxyphenyl transferase CofH [Gammaproteobacteria bacterium]